jgi:hypothetical protein
MIRGRNLRRSEIGERRPTIRQLRRQEGRKEVRSILFPNCRTTFTAKARVYADRIRRNF